MIDTEPQAAVSMGCEKGLKVSSVLEQIMDASCFSDVGGIHSYIGWLS